MVSKDLRSSRMPSAEGRGRARAAWDAYQDGAKKVLDPALDPIARHYASGTASELIGFWVLWHVHGGFAGLLKWGMPRTTIFRKVKRFREIFGVHPDEQEFPGISIDVAAYWAGSDEAEATRQRRRAELKAAKR